MSQINILFFYSSITIAAVTRHRNRNIHKFMPDLCDRSSNLYRVGKATALFSLPDACLGIETSIFQPDVSSGRSYQVVKVRRNLLGNVSSFFCLRWNKITDRQRCIVLCTALFSAFYRKSYFFRKKGSYEL